MKHILQATDEADEERQGCAAGWPRELMEEDVPVTWGHMDMPSIAVASTCMGQKAKSMLDRVLPHVYAALR